METPNNVVARYVFEYQHIAHSYFTGRVVNGLDGGSVREIELRGLHYLMIEVCENGTVYQFFVHNGVRHEFGDDLFSSGPQPGAIGSFIQGVWCPQSLSFSFLGLRGYPHHLQCVPFDKGHRHGNSLNKFLVVHRGRVARNRRCAIEPYTPWAILARVPNDARGFDRLVEKLKAAQPLPSAHDNLLSEIPSRL